MTSSARRPTAREAVDLGRALRPDVVLMDVRMPRWTASRRPGGSAPRRPTPRVLVLTTFDLDEYVYEALRAGASGFLLKDAPPERAGRAVRVVAAGDALLAPAVTRRLIDRVRRAGPTAPAGAGRLDGLTPRERDVLLLVARGLTNAEIAGELVVSEPTVKTHVAHVLMKLDLRDRIQAVVLAYESGLVRPGG